MVTGAVGIPVFDVNRTMPGDTALRSAVKCSSVATGAESFPNHRRIARPRQSNDFFAGFTRIAPQLPRTVTGRMIKR